MKPYLSVVVPIYKVEPYLAQCIESILAQTFRDLELILVDDGSPDKCPEICDTYAAKDDRIRVIHKPNGGLVSARKAGARIAQGQYITFVDSDDWIDEEMYATMKALADARGADVIITDFFYDRKGDVTRYFTVQAPGYYEGEDLEQLRQKMIYSGELYKPGIFPVVWNKWFKRELLMPNLEPIDEKISLGEDMACTYPCIIDAKSVELYQERCFYHYRWRPESMISEISPTYFKKYVWMYDYLTETLRKKGREDMVVQLMYHRLYVILMTGSLKYVGKLNDIFAGRSRKNLEFCFQNEDAKKITAGIDTSKMEITGFYRKVFKAYEQKNVWKIIWYAQVYRLQCKLGIRF